MRSVRDTLQGETVEMIFNDGSEHSGLDSGEESELDRELENLSEESSEPEGDIGEVRESENVEKEGEDPDWIEGEGTEVSRVRLVEWRMKNESPC